MLLLLTFSHYARAQDSLTRCAQKSLIDAGFDEDALGCFAKCIPIARLGGVHANPIDPTPKDGVDDSYWRCSGSEISDTCVSSFEAGNGNVTRIGSVAPEVKAHGVFRRSIPW
jgi:hypothetical protein